MLVENWRGRPIDRTLLDFENSYKCLTFLGDHFKKMP